jgi:Fe-S cluster biogenesis protein NfuA
MLSIFTQPRSGPAAAVRRRTFDEGSARIVMDTLTPAIVSEICQELTQDGVALRVAGFDPDGHSIELSLDVIDAECAECVIPADQLGRLVESLLRKRCDEVFAVTVRDPREAGPRPAGASPAGHRVIVLDPIPPAPEAASIMVDVSPGPAVGGLHGKSLLFRVDVLWRSWDWVVSEWSDLLAAAGASVTTWRRSQAVPGAEGQRLQDEYEALVDASDVLVSGLGNCGSCTTWTVRDALTGLSRDTATALVVTDHFAPLARILAQDAGRPGIRLLSLPYPLNPLPEDVVRKIAREHFPALLATLEARL